VANPYNYFKYAFLSGSKKNFKVMFDYVKNDIPSYLPELYKLKEELAVNGCLEKCTLNADYNYLENVKSLKESSDEAAEDVDAM